MRAAVVSWSKERGGLRRDQLTAMARALWTSPLYESRQSAVLMLERHARLLTPYDVPLIEHMLRTSRTWALVDGLAAKRRPELVASWLGPRVHRASGITVREAVKPLPPPVRDRLLAGYLAKRPVSPY